MFCSTAFFNVSSMTVIEKNGIMDRTTRKPKVIGRLRDYED